MDNNKTSNQSRRKFLYDLGLAGLSIPLISAGSQCNNDEGSNPQTMVNKNKEAGKLGIALVGLGSYAGGQLAPALLKTEHCYLAGIVTGTPSKAESWKDIKICFFNSVELPINTFPLYLITPLVRV